MCGATARSVPSPWPDASGPDLAYTVGSRTYGCSSSAYPSTDPCRLGRRTACTACTSYMLDCHTPVWPASSRVGACGMPCPGISRGSRESCCSCPRRSGAPRSPWVADVRVPPRRSRGICTGLSCCATYPTPGRARYATGRGTRGPRQRSSRRL